MTVTYTLWSVLVIMALVFVLPCATPQRQRSVSSRIYFSLFPVQTLAVTLSHTAACARAACDLRKHAASPVCSPAHTPLLTHIVPGLDRARCRCFFVNSQTSSLAVAYKYFLRVWNGQMPKFLFIMRKRVRPQPDTSTCILLKQMSQKCCDVK